MLVYTKLSCIINYVNYVSITKLKENQSELDQRDEIFGSGLILVMNRSCIGST